MTTQPKPATTMTAAQKRAAAKEAKLAAEAAAKAAEAAAAAADEDDGDEDVNSDQTPTPDVQLNEGEGEKAENGQDVIALAAQVNAVQATPTTLADVNVNGPSINAPAQTLTELAKNPSNAFVKETREVAEGITITGRGAQLTGGVRNETLPSFISSKYGLTEDQYSEALRRTIRGFEVYHMNMNSRAPVSLEEAARHQKAWYRIVAGALDSQLADSQVCFDVILFLANRHSDDLFTDRLACRAFNLLDDASRDTFNLFQTLILGLANPRTRSRYITTSVNIAVIERQIRSQNQRTNLLAYLQSAVN